MIESQDGVCAGMPIAWAPRYKSGYGGARPFTLVLMAGHVTLLSCAYQVILVLAGNAAARRLARIPELRKLAARLAGLALVGFGLRLALDRR